MHAAEKLSLEQIREFISASEELRFESENRVQRYEWIERVLIEQEYARQGRAARGLLKRFIEKMTGLSRAQVSRLIHSYTASGRVRVAAYARHRFAPRYTRADVELLASVDEAHETLSGPATQSILKREFEIYGKVEFERLAQISNGHLYNLRNSPRYRERRLNYTTTRPTAVQIGERRKPDPRGEPGFLRLDTVHQGDSPTAKGVYHINAVDEVTQWQLPPHGRRPVRGDPGIAAATARISEAYLLPVLESMLRQFPFRIQGFHSDNGSEFLNRTVAHLLEKLRIEQTKSRPRHSGDNGLVETKNGWVIRKHIGYGYIDQAHAEKIDCFYRDHLNPYLNYHRPCAQPEIEIDAKGRKRVRYRRYQTPLETLLALEKTNQYLRQRLSIQALKRIQMAHSDTDAAKRMQQAKARLFDLLRPIA